MKKVLTLFLFATLSLGLSAQTALDVELFPDLRRATSLDLDPSSRTASCGPDTAFYPFLKTFIGDTVFTGLASSGGSPVSGFSQGFEVPFHPVTVSGFSFYGWTNNAAGTPSTLVCSIFDADANMLPTGPALASQTITVDTVFGGGSFAALERFVTFPTPVTVGTNFILTAEVTTDSTLAFVVNNWETGAGQMESLSGLLFQGAWTEMESLAIGGVALDADVIMSPFVTYDITSAFTANPSDCLPQNDAITFTNNSSPIVTSRFFNLISFYAHFDQTPDSSYFWDFGDGNVSYDINPTHTYTDGGASYDVYLSSLVVGFSSGCLDSVVTTFNSGADAEASFTYSQITPNAATVNFIDSSPAAESWLWDFGDGNTSGDQSPTHTYSASGIYTVCLTITNCGLTDSVCMEMVSVWNTGIQDDLLNESLSVFPNPSTGAFNVALTLDKADPVSITVFNPIGQQVSVNNLGMTLNVNRQVNLSGMERGIYLLQVTVGDRQVIRRISLQ